MAQALVALGHEVRLAAPHAGSEPPPTGEAAWQALRNHYGLKHAFQVSWLPARPFFRRYDYGLWAVRWARGWGADCLYTRLPQAAALASRMGFPTIFEIHDLPQGRMGPRFLQWFLHGAGARRLVMITRALADDLALRLGVQAPAPLGVVAPDGVDLERYQEVPEPHQARLRLAPAIPGLDPQQFTAGYTGHLYAGRGAELILAVARRLPEVTFLLVGGEPHDVAHLQGQARDLQNVRLTGFKPNSEVPMYQAACDVLLMPYQHQVAASSGGNIARYLSPMKLFEYMACRRVIISGDLPVLREVLGPHNALLLPSDGVEDWALAIKNLSVDPELRRKLADRARQDVQAYTWEARAEKILPPSHRNPS